ncbi:peptidase M23, partial [Streptomyces sp. NPDC050147]|uniref:peptidase M23 n=1 Tax=Streptomyces sp. NPDC050147 TaxID=3155513 RepID=UPI003439D54B
MAPCRVPPDRDLDVTKTVYTVGRDLGVSDKVMLAGFEAGWVESHMNNLDCGDRDSLGVFQQRPSQGWGTPQQIRHVPYAAEQFFTRAIRVEEQHPNLTAGQTAQRVQRSAFPDRYDQAEGKARALLDEAKESVGPGKPDRRQRLAVGMSADGRVEVFHAAVDQIYHTYQHEPGGAWSGWRAFGGPASAALALTALPDGRLELFAMNGDTFMHRYQAKVSAEWADWYSFGGGGDHLAVGRNHDGRLEVFASNGDGVHHRWHNTPGGTWHDWRPLGGPAGARLAAAPASDGRIEVFAMNDDIFRHTCQTDLAGTWREWVDFGLGGEHLAVAKNRDGRLEVFATNSSGVHHRWRNVPAGDWHEWQPLGGPVGARLAVVESHDERIEVFAMNDDVVEHNYQVDASG